MPKAAALLIASVLVLTAAAPVAAQSGRNILLVANESSPRSLEIAEYYAGRRSVPSSQRLQLDVSAAEEVARAEYDQQIALPIARWLATNNAQDRILYIVLTKDIPLRIAGTGGQTGTVASVDSELSLLYRRLAGGRVAIAGRVPNPYFHAAGADDPKPFSHRDQDIYLVGRLDAYTVDDVKAMIDKGASPAHAGLVVLDGRLELLESVGNNWLADAARHLQAMPAWRDRVRLDTGQATLSGEAGVIGFYSWGSNARGTVSRHAGHTFLPGAIAGEYVSTDARTFKEPPADWTVNNTRAPFGGSHQSLIGDFIRDGITGVAGHVAEPYLNATIRPDVLFPAYARGFNLIEAFYLAMPALSWQTIVVGDVLCAPFGPERRPPADIDPPVDANTDLPAFFSARRVSALTAEGAHADAAPHLARSESRLAKGDTKGARAALERAVAVNPRYVPPQVLLATLLEAAEEWDAAIAGYRRVLELSPNHPVALNNLAYLTAVWKNDPAGALPLATRAYAVSRSDPRVGDTLAWTHHLAGDDAAATPIILAALQRLPESAELHLHAAFILAAANPASAARHLDTALQTDGTLARRDDVQELRRRLERPR